MVSAHRTCSNYHYDKVIFSPNSQYKNMTRDFITLLVQFMFWVATLPFSDAMKFAVKSMWS